LLLGALRDSLLASWTVATSCGANAALGCGVGVACGAGLEDGVDPAPGSVSELLGLPLEPVDGAPSTITPQDTVAGGAPPSVVASKVTIHDPGGSEATARQVPSIALPAASTSGTLRFANVAVADVAGSPVADA
jgi:hypothetical protein